jgi:hypothetical protein
MELVTVTSRVGRRALVIFNTVPPSVCSQAQQPVPDFLQEALAYAGGAAYANAAHGGQFGGSDIRVPGYGGNGFEDNQAPPPPPQNDGGDDWF